MKKGLAILLAASISMTAAAPICLASDLDGHWAEEYFLALEEMGIIAGYDDGSYKPDEKITRAEFFAVINRITKVIKNIGSTFSDIPENAWYKNAVDFAYTAKYASGYDDGTFHPNDYIKRSEAAAAICKAFGGDIETLSDFTDSVPVWAEGFVDMLVSAGLLSGYDDGTIRADDYITRGETVTIFKKLVGFIISSIGEIKNETYAENVIVSKSSVIFRDCTFEKDVYVCSGVSDGEVRFVNCTINGKVNMAGREDSSLVFEDTDCDKVCVYSTDETELICTGTSKIGNAVIRSKTIISKMNAEAGFSKITLYADADMNGAFDEVEVADGKAINVTEGSIDKLNVTASTNPKINVAGKVGTVQADKSLVLNGESINAGKTETNVTQKTGSTSVKYSYSLAALQNGTYDGTLSPGGSSENVVNKDYLLDNMTISAGTLNPTFTPAVTDYTLVVPNSAGALKIYPICDDLIECQVNGKKIGANGYEVTNYASNIKDIRFELISGLVKRTEYNIKVIGYGTDDTTLTAVTCDVPSTLTQTADSYSFMLTGTIDYSSGTIPATISFETLNSNTKVKVNGSEVTSYSVDLYDERIRAFTIDVVSEDNTVTDTYTIKVERPEITAIDDPDPTVVERVVTNPSSWVETDSRAMKLTSVDNTKLAKYKSYLDRIKSKADGLDVFGKQAVIQRAVDVVNEYDGKTIRLQAKDFYSHPDTSWDPVMRTSDYAVDSSGNVISGYEFVWASWHDFEFDAPVGTYEMKICWYQKFNNSVNIKVNNGATVTKSPPEHSIEAKSATESHFGITTMSVTLVDGTNTISMRKSDGTSVLDNTALAYIEFTFNF